MGSKGYIAKGISDTTNDNLKDPIFKSATVRLFNLKLKAAAIYTQPPLERSREICSTSFERYFPRNFN